MTTREELIYLAKIAEQADRYDDMVEFMKEAISLGGQLNIEERNLYSLANQCTINSRQSTYRQLIRMLQEAQIQFDQYYDHLNYLCIQAQVNLNQVNRVALIQSYMIKIRVEINIRIYQLDTVIDQHLLKAANTSEDKVIYLKMKGYNMSKLLHQEIGEQKQKQEVIDQIINSYQQAYDIAQERLKPTDIVRIGLVLTYSVFCYEQLNDTNKACSLSKQAIDDAKVEIYQNETGLYKDALCVVDLLEQNMALWMSEQDDNMIQQQNN